MTLPPRQHDPKGKQGARLRSPRHRAFVASHECIAYHLGNCQGRIDCCHCRDVSPEPHGAGRPSDYYCVSMCRRHHRESEKQELAWGQAVGINVTALCFEFAMASPDRAVREAVKALALSRGKKHDVSGRGEAERPRVS